MIKVVIKINNTTNRILVLVFAFLCSFVLSYNYYFSITNWFNSLMPEIKTATNTTNKPNYTARATITKTNTIKPTLPKLITIKPNNIRLKVNTPINTIKSNLYLIQNIGTFTLTPKPTINNITIIPTQTNEVTPIPSISPTDLYQSPLPTQNEDQN